MVLMLRYHSAHLREVTIFLLKETYTKNIFVNSTARLLLGYGNVKLSQGNGTESFILHQRCLMQDRSTIGPNHHRTADGCGKVASHCTRLGDLSNGPVS